MTVISHIVWTFRYEERQKMKEDEELAKKLLARDSKKQEGKNVVEVYLSVYSFIYLFNLPFIFFIHLDYE